VHSPFDKEALFELKCIKALELVDWHPSLGSFILQRLQAPNLRELHLSNHNNITSDSADTLFATTFDDKYDPHDWEDFCSANKLKLNLITRLSLCVPPGVYTFTRRFQGNFSLNDFGNLTHLTLHLGKAKVDFLKYAFQLTENEIAMPTLISLLLYFGDWPKYSEDSLGEDWIPAIGHLLQERQKRGVSIQNLWIYSIEAVSLKDQQRLQRSCNATQLSILQTREAESKGWDPIQLHKLIGV
jgi:hypothetical protein